MVNNIFLKAIKVIFLEIIWEIIFFPIWWYNQGLKRVILYVWNSLKNSSRILALPIMFKNLFKPMFGQYDREGRLISFLMRIILTISRVLVFLVLLFLNIIILLIWILLPVVVIWLYIANLESLWKQ